MRAKRVLQTTAHVPAEVTVVFPVSGEIEPCAGRVHVVQSRLIFDVAECTTAGEIRQPVSNGIADATSERGKIIRPESLLDTLVAHDRIDERAGIKRIAQEHVATVAFNAENPAAALEIEADQPANLTAMRVEVIGRMIFNGGLVDREQIPIAGRIQVGIKAGELVSAKGTDIEAAPIEAFWRRGRRDLFHFFSARQRLWAADCRERKRERRASRNG
jgi:hypothetical protein